MGCAGYLKPPGVSSWRLQSLDLMYCRIFHELLCWCMPPDSVVIGIWCVMCKWRPLDCCGHMVILVFFCRRRLPWDPRVARPRPRRRPTASLSSIVQQLRPTPSLTAPTSCVPRPCIPGPSPCVWLMLCITTCFSGSPPSPFPFSPAGSGLWVMSKAARRQRCV